MRSPTNNHSQHSRHITISQVTVLLYIHTGAVFMQCDFLQSFLGSQSVHPVALSVPPILLLRPREFFLNYVPILCALPFLRPKTFCKTKHYMDAPKTGNSKTISLCSTTCLNFQQRQVLAKKLSLCAFLGHITPSLFASLPIVPHL